MSVDKVKEYCADIRWYMKNRCQRRKKAILPVKITVAGTNRAFLTHTLDISASGVRLVLASAVQPGEKVTIEHKRRRVVGTVAWQRPVQGSKFDIEIGIMLQNAGNDFWGIALPLNEPDEQESHGLESIPFSKIMSLLSAKPSERNR
jgi:hypothetical protein